MAIQILIYINTISCTKHPDGMQLQPSFLLCVKYLRIMSLVTHYKAKLSIQYILFVHVAI